MGLEGGLVGLQVGLGLGGLVHRYCLSFVRSYVMYFIRLTMRRQQFELRCVLPASNYMRRQQYDNLFSIIGEAKTSTVLCTGSAEWGLPVL